MRIRVLAGLGAIVIQLVSVSAAGAARQSKTWAGHLTEKALERVEPRLQALVPGTPLSETGLEWRYFKVVERRKTIGLSVELDGWIGFLSGGLQGAAGGLGSLRGVSEGSLHGEHVFGYLWGGATLVPRYVVRTRARRSTEEEDADIDRSMVGAGGRVESGGQLFFYRDVVVEEVRETSFGKPQKKGAETKRLRSRDLETWLTSFASRGSFARVEPKIEAMKPGCDLLDAIAELGGLYMTLNFGKDYILLLDGHLRPWMEEGAYPSVSIASQGRYYVWPFGYLENDTPSVQVGLVFRNGELVTVLEDASKEGVARFLERQQ